MLFSTKALGGYDGRIIIKKLRLVNFPILFKA